MRDVFVLFMFSNDIKCPHGLVSPYIGQTHTTEFKNCSNHDEFLLILGSQNAPVLAVVGYIL